MKLLIVDDEITARTVLKEHLGRLLAHAEIAEAENGAEALFQLLQYQPDLVLLDLMMPVTDGEVFLNVVEEWAAKKLIADLPRVVVITSFNDAAKLMELSNRPSVIKVLPKPITAITMIRRSTHVPAFHAASTPIGTAIAMDITSVITISEIVVGARCSIIFNTGRLVKMEVPRLPCSTCHSQSAKRMTNGLSSPRVARICAICCVVAWSPAMIAAGSPGAM